MLFIHLISKSTAMNRLFTILLSLILSQSAQSQTFDWVLVDSIASNSGATLGYTQICHDQSASLWTAQMALYRMSYSLDALGTIELRKSDEDGNLINTVSLGPKASIRDIETDQSNNLYVTGMFLDTLIIFGQDTLFPPEGASQNNFQYLAAFNSDGELLWIKNPIDIAGASNQGGELAIATNGNIYCTFEDFLSAKILIYSPTGQFQDLISLNGIQVCGEMIIDSADDIYIAGGTFGGNISIGSLSATAPFSYNVFLVKISADGNGQWINFVEDITLQQPDLAMDESGNIYMTGDMNDDMQFGTIMLEGSQWVYDFFLVKCDSNGTFLFATEVPNTQDMLTGDFQRGFGDCLTINSMGNPVLTGVQRGTINWGNITTELPSITNNALAILQFDDENGELIAGRLMDSITYTGLPVSVISMGESIYINAVVSSMDGYLFDEIEITANYERNNLFARINPYADITKVVKTDADSDRILVYPNPANQIIYLKNNFNGAISIYNVNGELVIEELNHKGYLDVSGLRSGIYLVKTANQTIRFIKE